MDGCHFHTDGQKAHAVIPVQVDQTAGLFRQHQGSAQQLRVMPIHAIDLKQFCTTVDHFKIVGIFFQGLFHVGQGFRPNAMLIRLEPLYGAFPVVVAVLIPQ